MILIKIKKKFNYDDDIILIIYYNYLLQLIIYDKMNDFLNIFFYTMFYFFSLSEKKKFTRMELRNKWRNG